MRSVSSPWVQLFISLFVRLDKLLSNSCFSVSYPNGYSFALGTYTWYVCIATSFRKMHLHNCKIICWNKIAYVPKTIRQNYHSPLLFTTLHKTSVFRASTPPTYHCDEAFWRMATTSNPWKCLVLFIQTSEIWVMLQCLQIYLIRYASETW